MRRRKILFVSGALTGGGAEGQLFQLANALSDLGHGVTVATLSAQKVPGQFTQHSVCGRMTRSRLLNSLALGSAALRIALLIRHSRPDVVVTWLAVPTLMGAAAAAGTRTPRIAALRNAHPESMRSMPPRIMRWLLQAALSRATMIIANSAAGIAGYRALGLISHERTVQIGNCIDTKRFHPPSLERRLRARTHFEIPPNLNVVAYVGRDAPEKDLKLLVRSLSELPLHVQRLLVIVVGVSEQRLTELAASEGVRLPSSMQVHARMQNIEDVYMATDVLLLTSRHEGSPNVVHEARACGVAIVSTDCGDVRETMQAQDRVVRSDPSCLAEAVAAVLKIGLDQRVPPSPMSPTDCARRWAAAIESILPSEA